MIRPFFIAVGTYEFSPDNRYDLKKMLIARDYS